MALLVALAVIVRDRSVETKGIDLDVSDSCAARPLQLTRSATVSTRRARTSAKSASESFFIRAPRKSAARALPPRAISLPGALLCDQLQVNGNEPKHVPSAIWQDMLLCCAIAKQLWNAWTSIEQRRATHA